MSLAVLERPQAAVRPSKPATAASRPGVPPATAAAPLSAAIVKAMGVYVLVAGLMAAIHWPVLVASDVATRLGIALQLAMTASCVAGWLSLILIFDRFIGERH